MIAQLQKLSAVLGPRNRRNAFILLLFMLVGAGLEVIGVAAVPAFVSALIYPEKLEQYPLVVDTLNAIGAGGTRELVVVGAALLVVVFAVKNAFLVLNYHLQTKYTTNRRVEISRRLVAAYMRAPFTFHLARNTSELFRNVDREANAISGQVIGAILELMTHMTILVAVLCFLFVAEPWLTFWWLVVFGLIAAIGIRAMSAKMNRFGLEEQEQRKQFTQALYQGFGSIKESRVLNREDFFAGKVGASVQRIARVMRFKQFITKSIAPITEFVAIAGLLGIVAILVLIGRPTESILVTLSLFIFGMVRLRQTIGAVLGHLAGLRYSIVSINPVYKDLKTLEPADWWREEGEQAPGEPRSLRQAIELRDVWYTHDQSNDHALKGVSLNIPAGAVVGFVGSTGAGKSTLVDVILGLLEPEEGTVLVDGEDIRQSGVSAWQRNIGYVPQSIYLLDDTIRRNIALGLPDDAIDEHAVWTAVRKAQLEEFVKRQPNGLDTMIGEHGVRISGGERQRVGIARSLYHDPEVLILDEATSALDNATEKAIIGAVDALRGQRTIIMIAHRLTTVQNCDTLYFLKQGRIEATGNFPELQERHEEFRIMATG